MLYAMFIYLILLNDNACEIYTITPVHDIKLASTTFLLSSGLAFPNAVLFRTLEDAVPSQLARVASSMVTAYSKCDFAFHAM